MNKDTRLYRVVLSYAVFGVITEKGTITQTAPIAKWAIGKDIVTYFSWVARKGGEIKEILK